MLALAAQLSLPVVVGARVPDIRGVFSSDDFPAYVQRAGKPRGVFTRTTVRPDGTIQSCVPEATSGDAKLDAYTCAIIVKRAKFQPATWDGSPTYGVIRVTAWWVFGPPVSKQASMKAIVADIDLSVDRLPKGADSMALTRLQVGADEKGRALSCAEVPPTDKTAAKDHLPELVPVACQQVLANLTLIPPVDDVGKPARSVQTVMVRFELNQPSAAAQTPEMAMDYLVKTLPHLQSLDTWVGGHSEATFDRAWVINRCRLGTGAPFDKIYSDYEGEHEAPMRQSWWTDFSEVSGVGQLGNRAIYKTRRDKRIVLGILAADERTAEQIARAMETLRLACTKAPPPKH